MSLSSQVNSVTQVKSATQVVKIFMWSGKAKKKDVSVLDEKLKKKKIKLMKYVVL